MRTLKSSNSTDLVKNLASKLNTINNVRALSVIVVIGLWTGVDHICGVDGHGLIVMGLITVIKFAICVVMSNF